MLDIHFMEIFCVLIDLAYAFLYFVHIVYQNVCSRMNQIKKSKQKKITYKPRETKTQLNEKCETKLIIGYVWRILNFIIVLNVVCLCLETTLHRRDYIKKKLVEKKRHRVFM